MNLFRKWGWFYRPTSIIGWLLLFALIIFCLQVFIVVDAKSHSISDTLYGVFPYFVCALVIFYWISFNTSNNK